MKRISMILTTLFVAAAFQAGSAEACIPSVTTDTTYNVHMLGRRDLNIDVSGFSRASVVLRVQRTIATRAIPRISGDEGVVKAVPVGREQGFVLYKYEVLGTGRVTISVPVTNGPALQQKIEGRLLATPRSVGGC